jgi:hypothetical protein
VHKPTAVAATGFNADGTTRVPGQLVIAMLVPTIKNGLSLRVGRATGAAA